MKTFLSIITFLGVILGIVASVVSIKADTITYKESTKYEKFTTEDISIGYLWKEVNFKVVYLMDSYKWELGREDQLTSGQNID